MKRGPSLRTVALEAPMTKQSILDILEGRVPEEPAEAAAAPEGRDGDLPSEEPTEAPEEAPPLPDIHKTLGGQSKEEVASVIMQVVQTRQRDVFTKVGVKSEMMAYFDGLVEDVAPSV